MKKIKIPIFQIDAFAEKLFQGNPAAVCPLEAWLPESILQSIAEENNLAETAFFVKGNDGYDLRWFTPSKEVDLCGHATLASAFVLFEQLGFNGKEIVFQSKSGKLKVKKDEDLLTLDFPAQVGTECSVPDVMVDALRLRPKAVYQAADYMAVFEKEEDIVSIKPDFGLLAELDLRGVIVTAPGNSVDFVSRFFAPNFGINEDSVTGAAHCTLAPYWSKRLGRNPLSAKQLSKRTGSLMCEVNGDRIFISGKAVPYLEGIIEVDC